MSEKQKEKAKKTKPAEPKPVRKHIAWSRGTPTIVVPATIRDALGLKSGVKTEIEVSLLGDELGILIHILAPSLDGK